MKRRNYWKELCLLLIGLLIGMKVEKPPIPVSSETVVHDTIICRDTLYLNKENVLSELKRQNVPHADVVLNQSRLETGHFKSKVCKNNNNLFGIRKNGKYKSYPNWKESITDYKKLISSKYKGGDYYEFLEFYAEDPEYINKLKSMI